MNKKKPDHIYFSSQTGTMECSRCGGFYIMNLPVPVGLLVAIAKAWVNMHKNCKEVEG